MEQFLLESSEVDNSYRLVGRRRPEQRSVLDLYELPRRKNRFLRQHYGPIIAILGLVTFAVFTILFGTIFGHWKSALEDGESIPFSNVGLSVGGPKMESQRGTSLEDKPSISRISLSKKPSMREMFARDGYLPVDIRELLQNRDPNSVDDHNNHEADIVVHNYLNAQYFGDVVVGSSREVFSVIFDTGSSNFWLPSSQCSGISGSHHVYDHEASTSYHPDGRPFKIQYGSGPVSGFLSTDQVSAGNISLTSYTFAEITDVSGLGLAYRLGMFDGIFGLGFPSIAVDGIVPPFIEMANRKLLPEAVFAFYLSPQNGENGELVFGGYDPQHFTGNITWVDLKHESYWEVPIEDIRIGSLSLSAQSAIIDSGTSLLAGPSEDVRALAAEIGARAVPFQPGAFIIDCDKTESLPSVTFGIGGEMFVLDPKDYVLKTGDDPSLPCLLGFTPIDVPPPEGPLWILGDIFMRRYYSIFDVERHRMGFALANPRPHS